eukprot:scaffold9654_cov61-Phaeocystis_antarctica.AAC.4
MRIESRQTRLKGTKRRDSRSGGCGAFGGDAPVDKVAAALAGGTRAREEGAMLRDAARVVAACGRRPEGDRLRKVAWVLVPRVERGPRDPVCLQRGARIGHTGDAVKPRAAARSKASIRPFVVQ